MPQARRYPDHAARQRAYRARQTQARLTEQHAKGVPPAAPIPTLPSRARWGALLAHARVFLEMARDELQAYTEARSDQWQESDQAALLAEQLDGVEQVLADLDALPPFGRR